MPENDEIFTLIPEWAPVRAVAFAWPEQLPGAGREKAEVHLHAVRSLQALLNHLCLHYITVRLSGMRNVWIRDWAPVPVRARDGAVRLVKAKYRPRYLYREEAMPDDSAGRKLARVLNLPVVELPLVWDFGNLTHNGEGIGIVTERLLADNSGSYRREDIELLCGSMLGLEKLVVVPEEPGDPTGHIDGMVRFLDERTAAVASYPDAYPEGKAFMDEVAVQVERELGEGFRVARIPNGVPPAREEEGIPSAFDNHLNFLRLGNTILLPVYGIEEDGAAVASISRACIDITVSGIGPRHVDELSHRGGALSCISWVLFE
jgi:agmatine deiminase